MQSMIQKYNQEKVATTAEIDRLNQCVENLIDECMVLERITQVNMRSTPVTSLRKVIGRAATVME